MKDNEQKTKQVFSQYFLQFCMKWSPVTKKKEKKMRMDLSPACQGFFTRSFSFHYRNHITHFWCNIMSAWVYLVMWQWSDLKHIFIIWILIVMERLKTCNLRTYIFLHACESKMFYKIRRKHKRF